MQGKLETIKEYIKNNQSLFFTMLMGIFLSAYQIKFGTGKTLNTLLFLTSAVGIVLSFNHGLAILLISFSTFTLGVFFSVVTFGITIYYQISFFALTVLFCVMVKDWKKLRLMNRFDLVVSLLFFINLVLFSFIGVLRGGAVSEVIKEFFLFGLWLIPLIVPYYLNRKSAKYLINTIIGICIFVSFLYLRADFLGIYNFDNNRVYTRHVFIYVFALPYIFSMFLVAKRKKAFYIGVMILSMWGLLITQTRSVLLGILLSIIGTILLVKGINFKRTAILVVVSLIGYVLFINYFPNEIIRDRVASFSEFYKDNSFLMRFVTTYDVVSQHGFDLIKGLGLANTFYLNENPLYSAMSAYWVDIGYLSIIAKTSISGLLLILIIVGRVFYNCVVQYKKGVYKNVYHKTVIIGSICAILSVLLINFLFPIMIKYIYLIIFCTLITLPQYYKIEEERFIRKEEKLLNDF